MKLTNTTLITLFLSLLLYSCGKSEEGAQASILKAELENFGQIEKSKLLLFKVNSKTKQVDELISGRVIPKSQTQLFAEVQGLISPSSKTFKAGDKFKKGEILISIDSREFDLNLKSQKSAFLIALTGLMTDLKSDYPDNFQPWQTYLENFDLQRPLADLPESKSKSEQFFISSRGIYTSYFGLKAQEARLAKYTIYAPYNGIITHSMIDVGGLVSPGQALGTIISSAAFEVETGVSLKLGSQLKVGDQISFKSNDISGSWVGVLSRIGGTVDPQTQNIPVYFSIVGKELVPGMYLQGYSSSARYDDVYVIPSSAIDRDGSVLVLENNLIASKMVQTVQTIQDSTLVKGLFDNDQVILTQFAQPMVGKKVTQ